MKFKYRLPDGWIAKVSGMEEFANGATQVTIRLNDKREIAAWIEFIEAESVSGAFPPSRST